jgi:hypothetical protein
MIGNKVEKGEGYNLKNLNNIRKRFQKLGCEVELYCLNDELDKVNEEINKAYVLVIRNAIQKVWNLYPELVEEQKNLKDLPNTKLVEFMDLLSSDFEITKQSIINSTVYLDKIEELYNNVLNVYQDRTNGK